jgi:hypothetical protein
MPTGETGAWGASWPVGAETPVEVLARPATIAARCRVARIGGLPLGLPPSRGIEDPELLLAIESGQRGGDP